MLYLKISRAQLRSGVELLGVVAPLVEQITINTNCGPCHPDIKKNKFMCCIDTTQLNLQRKSRRTNVFFNEGECEVIDVEGNAVETQSSITAQHPFQQPIQISPLTDEEILQKQLDTFLSLADLSQAAAKRKIRSMIVAGSAGTGKTYEVMKALLNEEKEDPTFYHKTIKGTISPIALYIQLYEARDGVLILDDSDEAFSDQESLQLLKAATESNKTRLVSDTKLSRALEENGIPQSFVFNGCVVVLTNTNLEGARQSKAPHYEAIMSRAHYINAILATPREKLIRIRYVIESSDILSGYVEEENHSQIIQFIEDNHEKLRDLSLRTVVKLAEIFNAFPDKWQRLARGTLLK